VTARQNDGKDWAAPHFPTVTGFDGSAQLDTSVIVPAPALATVLASVTDLAVRRGLPAEERDELLAMVTPLPQHIGAA
jgi:hypothetical protein